jgi:hypothetical protein
MEITIEEIKKENDFVTVFDDDGMVTIQMSEESVKKIIDIFNEKIISKENHSAVVEVTEFDNTFELDLILKNNSDYFSITGSIVGSNFYHDFELESCNLKTWNDIVSLTNS